MKNYGEMVKDKQKRQLTAKGNSFIWRCIDIIAKSKGLNRYSPEMKETKETFKELAHHLLIDKELSQKKIIEIIKNSNLTETKIQIL